MSFFVILVYFGRNSVIKYLLKSGKNGQNFASFNKKLLISLLQWLSTAPLPKGDEYQWDYFPNTGRGCMMRGAEEVVMSISLAQQDSR